MNTFVRHGLGIVLLVLFTAAAPRAEIIRDLYSAEVPVADQSPAQLASASRAALETVFVKVSGSAGVLRNPAIVAALPGARQHVQQYSYSKDPAVPGALKVQMLFDQGYVTRLMIEAGAPVWTANRPAVLVWLVRQDAAGGQFVSAETDPALVAELRREFSRRGVPLQLPLYDLADTAALSVEQALNLDGAALKQASARYQLQNVLVGVFALQADGRVAGKWNYFSDSDQSQRSATTESEALFLREGVGLVAEAMAARYAVAASAQDVGLAMSVTGVTSYADYAAVVSWLESLELVDRADVASVQGDSILVRLQAKAAPDQLATVIELNKRLVPMPVTGAGTDLNYLWQK
ncbi:MAG: DUF2066 domain-containing protein [Halieaceae bacterium]|nr:DUF2066 domain-containing protein [Halieaceae bacterium]